MKVSELLQGVHWCKRIYKDIELRQEKKMNVKKIVEQISLEDKIAVGKISGIRKNLKNIIFRA